MLSSGKLISLSFSLLVVCAFLFPAPAYCEGDPIAHLTHFTGTVLIKNQSSWGDPAKNLPLYSMDKVVTRVGTAVITFADGAVVEIKNNTNLLIQEMEKEEGLMKKAKIVQRRIILFLGKMFFKTGKGNVQTQFETEKSVIGIRGTAGVLSIGSDGQIYIEFTEGDAKFTVGDLILGKVAKDVPTEVIDQALIQKAAYMAHAAWKRCGEAKDKASKGEISPDQREWACAYAMEMSSREVKTWSEALVQNNPSEDVVEWAKEIIVLEDISIEKAIKSQEQAVERGASPEPIDEYTPPETQGGVEGYEEPGTEPDTLQTAGETGGDEFSDPLPQDNMPNSPVGSN